MDSCDINLPEATPDKNRGEMKNGEKHMYFIEKCEYWECPQKFNLTEVLIGVLISSL